MTCFNCNKEFISNKSERKFCSQSCAAIHNNKYYKKRKLTNTCKGCGILCNSGKTYCNNTCYQIHRKRGKNPKVASNAVKNFIQRLKIKCVEYKGGCCEKCGYNRCIAALHFHHINPDVKEFNISGRSISFERMRPELDKCILVCANCHSEIHNGII